MRQTLLQIKRGNTNVGPLIRAQIDQSSDREIIEHRTVYNFQGFDTYKIITLEWPATLMQRGDVLVDQQFTDEATNTNFHYKIFTRVKNYDRDHQECSAQVVVGT